MLLVVGGLSDSASAADKPQDSAKSDKITSRPDRVSAMSTAQAQKSKVEDLSARTSSSSTFANFDGTWTTKATAGATRTEDADGHWVDLNSDVTKSGGKYEPKASAYDLSFSDGGDKTVASVKSPSGDTVGVGWPTDLPSPVAKGDTLTYVGAADGSDLVVTSLPDGFDYSVVLDKAPDPSGGPVEFRVPLQVKGAKASVAKDGSVTVKDGKHLIASMSAPVMWDGAKANANGKGETNPVTTTVDDSGSTPVLVLKPDMKFLADPSTVYPLTVDPTLTLAVAADTWVQSAGDTTSQLNSPELHVGSIDGGTTVSRSYVYFDLASFAAVPASQVVTAKMTLSNFETGACTGTSLTMSRITGGWNTSALTWANQPAVTATGAASSSQSFGATGCTTEGNVDFSATQIVKDWIGGATNLGVQVKSDNETSASGWRKFRAHENGDPAKYATLTMTYGAPPNTPGTTVVSPAVSDGSTQLSNSTTPSFSTGVSDPDGDQVTAHFKLLQGSTVIDSADVGPVPSGSKVYRKPTSDVPDGTYTAQWQADDGTATSAWSTPVTVVVDHTPPAAPTVACTSTAANTWYDTRPATTSTCTITGATGTAVANATLNGVDAGFPDLSGTTTSKSFTLPTNGMFNLQVTASDKAGNTVSKGYSFGVGTGSLTSPLSGAKSVNRFVINATSKSGALSAQVQWRLAGNTTWIQATHVTQGIFGWTGLPSNVGTTSVSGDLNWDAADETGAINPSLVEARFCFYYTGGTSRCTALTQVNLVPHAFGGSFPTSDVGPASVSLQTGEFQVDSNDVSVPGFGDDIGLSRTYQSFGTPASDAQGVFGPGWLANLDGPSAGFGAAQVVDHTATNGTISLIDTDGDASTYLFTAGGHVAQATGFYKGQGDAAANNEKLELKAGTTKTLVLTEPDGTVTTWSFVASKWTPTSVVDPTAAPATTYSYSAGLVTGIYAGIPGVNCKESVQDKGCHALLLTYTTIGTDQRLSKVQLRTWDAATSAMKNTTVENYSYDSSGRLISAYDQREDTTSGHLTTDYTYQTVAGKSYLSTISPPAEKTWHLNLNSDGTLNTVTRDQDAAVGGTALWHVVYGIGMSGTGLPDLTSNGVSRWSQTQAPDAATAVFGPDAPDTSAKTAGTLTPSELTYADISYFTKSGQTTNNATYGAGDWQIDSHEYDQYDNETRTLSAQALAYGIKNGWNQYALHLMLSTNTVYNAAGNRVEYVLAPQRYVRLKDGTGMWARPRTDTVYDDEAAAEGVPVPGRPTTVLGPNDPIPNIPVEVRNYVTDWDGAAIHLAGSHTWDTHKSRYRYDKVVSTDGDGWALHTPTRTSVDLGSGWSTSLTRFDNYGQTIETRTPQGVSTLDGAGADAKSMITTYFTADTSSPVVACRSKAEWAGKVCQTGPAASTGNDPANAVTGYDYLQNPTGMTESSGSMTRTTTVTYDIAGRKKTESVALTGAPAGDKQIPDTTYVYSPANGDLQSTSTTAGSVDLTYDTWGRVLTGTDGAGNTATATYDFAGRVKTLNDGKGTYSYTYDGTDSTGKAERRGLVTKLDVGLASGPDVYTASYDAGGNMTQVELPNGVIQDNTYDITGDKSSLVYSRNGTAFLAEINNVDIQGRTRIDQTSASTRYYTYDNRNRLTNVQDYYGGGGCITRAYGFSLDSDRTSLATSSYGAGGACSTSSPVTKTSTFDTDDKVTNAGYSYDAFGRTQTVPAVDTDQTGGGALSVDYYANDMVAHLAQNTPTAGGPLSEKTYSLDSLRRIAGTTTATSGVDLHKTTNHYSGDTDTPAWTDDQTRPDGTSSWTSSWTRNVNGPDGNLGIIQKSDGTSQVQLSNIHGDIVSTMANTTTGSAAVENYADSTEYGIPEPGFPALGQQYEWLGSRQRSTDSIGGLTLMGARLYNPNTGLFLSLDAVPGGNDNPYIYPADPINQLDLDGLFVFYQWSPWLRVPKTRWTIWKDPVRWYGKTGYQIRMIQEGVVRYKVRVSNEGSRPVKTQHGIRTAVQYRVYQRTLWVTWRGIVWRTWRSGWGNLSSHVSKL